MCCIADKKSKDKFLAEMKKKRRKTFIAWKAVNGDEGAAIMGKHTYCPGTHTAHVTEDTYDRMSPRGIHVFIDERHAAYYASFFNRILVPVQCSIDDLVIISRDDSCYSYKGVNSQEAVLTKIRILKKDFELQKRQERMRTPMSSGFRVKA